MDVEALFARVVDELEQRLAKADDEYQILRASGLLRFLLLDQRPLLVTIAQSRGVPLQFAIRARGVTMRPIEAPGPTLMGFSVAPWPGVRTEVVTLSDFLTRETVVTVGASFTVRAVIKVAAIAFGGVHYMDPHNPDERALVDLVRSFGTDDLDVLGGVLSDVGAVALATARPLVRADTQPRA